MNPMGIAGWQAVRSIGRDLLQLIYPQLCAGCGSDIVSSTGRICLDCLESLPHTGFYQHRDNPVERIFQGRLNILAAASLFYFAKRSPIQRMLHRLKYQGDRELGIILGRMMGIALHDSDLYRNADALIPLPLFYNREKQRGYNQSALLCNGIAAVTGLPILDSVITRKRESETQTKKTRAQRWQNIEGKFVTIDAASCSGKFVVLVDDVLTTGATLEACGAELLKIKDLKLGFATLAYTSS